MGKSGGKGYEVSGQEYPGWMYEMLAVVMPYVGITEEADWPNSCTANLYDSGGSSISWHADDLEIFNGTLKDMRIVALSLGATRTFEIRHFDSKKIERCVLDDGDLYVMEGMTQKHYVHRLPPEGQMMQPRINLSWRWIVKHSKICPSVGVAPPPRRTTVNMDKLKLAYMPLA